MKKEKLEACTRKVLAEMARKKGVAGWQTLRKEELVDALAETNGHHRATNRVAAAVKNPVRRGATRTPVQTAVARRTSRAKAEDKHHVAGRGPTRDLAAPRAKDLPKSHAKDRITLMVKDPYWLHCCWDLTRQAVQRAEASFGQDWHLTKPILRLVDVSSQDTTSSAERVLRDIEIHGGCNNWYIDVANPPRSYRVDIGYVSSRGKFFVLARSNTVTTPRAGVSDAIDHHWTGFDEKQADRIYAMSSGFDPAGSNLELKQLFEERLGRPLGSPAVTTMGPACWLPGKARKFNFEINAELIVYGSTEPHARVTLQGEPVRLRPDGTFTMRFSLPDSRQIIPAVALSADGIEERTIVLAIERNTKQLEPMIKDGSE